MNPSKLVDRIGNILTPILLLSIFLLFVKSVFTPLGQSGPAMQEYQTSPIFKGFMEGYLTMDTISALAFGIIVVNTIRSKGVRIVNPLPSQQPKLDLLLLLASYLYMVRLAGSVQLVSRSDMQRMVDNYLL